MTKEKDEDYLLRKEKIIEFLKNEGFRPDFYKSGDIFFKQEGVTVCLFISQDDLDYYRVVRYDVISINNEDEMVAALEACNSLNRSMKIAKSYINEDRNSVHIEVPNFNKTSDNFILVAKRIINQAFYCQQDLILNYNSLIRDGIAATEMSKALSSIISNSKNYPQ